MTLGGRGCISIAPNGRDLAMATPSSTLTLVDLESVPVHGRFVSPSTNRTSAPSSLLQFDLPQPSMDFSLNGSGGTGDLCCQWHPFHSHHEWLLSTNQQHILLWDLHRLTSSDPPSSWLRAISDPHHGTVTDVHWSLFDPHILASCSMDAFVHLWDTRLPDSLPAHAFLPGIGMAAAGIQVQWNHKSEFTLASAHMDSVIVWDVRKGSIPLHVIQVPYSVAGLDWSHVDEVEVLTFGYEREGVDIWNVREPLAPLVTLSTMATRAKYTPFGEGILIADAPCQTKNTLSMTLWSRVSQCPVLNLEDENLAAVRDIGWRVLRGAVEPSGSDDREFQLISWGWDGSLEIWPLDTDTLKQLGHEAATPVSASRDTSTDQSSQGHHSLLSAVQTDQSFVPSNIDESSPVFIMHPLVCKTVLMERESTMRAVALEKSQTVRHLMDECTMVQKVFPSIRVVHHEQRVTLYVPVSIADKRLVSEWQFDFPDGYPRIDRIPTVQILFPKSPFDIFDRLLIELEKVFVYAIARHDQNGLEAVLDHMLRRLNKDKQLRSSSRRRLYSFSVGDDDDRLYSDDADSDADDGYGKNTNNDVRVPFPRLCSGTFASDGSLIMIFSNFGMQPSNVLFTGIPKSFEKFRDFKRVIASSTSLEDESVDEESVDEIDLLMGSVSNLPATIEPSSVNSRTSSTHLGSLLDMAKKAPAPRSKSYQVHILSMASLSNATRALGESYLLCGMDPVSLCRYNSQVAHKHGQKHLTGTWNLAAYINLLCKDGKNAPLSFTLAQRILAFYEKIGDIQTYAMLTCVFDQVGSENWSKHSKPVIEPDVPPPALIRKLPTRRRPAKLADWGWSATVKSFAQLLDASEMQKWYHYRYRYAEMLYGWGLLTKRAEMLKYIPSMRTQSLSNGTLEFLPQCEQCGARCLGAGCAKCHRPALICAICHRPPQGLALFCLICGHGGHLEHMKDWFQLENEGQCPAGCGCQCLMMNVLL